jgi:hypothetical protein
MAAGVLAHLDAQMDSARRLLGAVLEQGAAIRAREVSDVLRTMTDIQAEMSGRGRLERERTDLLTRAGHTLGLAPEAVTLEALVTLMGPEEAQAARRRSAELRGLLAEIAREHGVNRALMRQELAFLEHLTRMIGGGDAGAYAPPVRHQRAEPGVGTLRVLDLEA